MTQGSSCFHYYKNSEWHLEVSLRRILTARHRKNAQQFEEQDVKEGSSTNHNLLDLRLADFLLT